MADYLKYWPWREVQFQLQMWQLFVHDNSAQFERSRVAPGDTIWYVTIEHSTRELAQGPLTLFGRIRVGRVWGGDHAAVQDYLERRYQIAWDVRDVADYHITPIQGTEQAVELIASPTLAADIRFVGDHDGLVTENGIITNALQLQSMRKLTPESAELIAGLWESRLPDLPRPSKVVGVGLEEGETPDEWPEGKEAWKTHRMRERNRSLIRMAKEQFIKAHGHLFCQVCDFDFAKQYGAHGAGYIEAHHTLPVSEMSVGHATRVDDLAMVCANCHRMLHYRRPWLRMHELREILVQAEGDVITH